METLLSIILIAGFAALAYAFFKGKKNKRNGDDD